MTYGLSVDIIYVLKRGLQWRDVPKEYGPYKILYNRFIRWSRKGVFEQILIAWAAQEDSPDQLQIDATHLNAHRTAASLLKKGAELQASCRMRRNRTPSDHASVTRTDERLQRCQTTI
uniref:Putative transposase n=1 Tax=Candidatus Kentrum sp. FW TaxID=2126338 RepID=A0A450U246_9GAMM|nr:MAG: putative transposase [Candidatus Kentron sp. FW]